MDKFLDTLLLLISDFESKVRDHSRALGSSYSVQDVYLLAVDKSRKNLVDFVSKSPVGLSNHSVSLLRELQNELEERYTEKALNDWPFSHIQTVINNENLRRKS